MCLLLTTITLQRRYDFRRAAAESHGAAAGQSGEEVRVGLGEEAAGAVAGCVQAFDGSAVFTDDLHIGVDAAAVQGGQVPCAGADAVEWRGVDRGQPVRFFAIVLIYACRAQLVVVLNGGDEGVCRDIQLFCELFEGVGFLHIAVLDQSLDGAPYIIIGHIGERAVRERKQTAAADLVKLFRILLVIRVENVTVGMIGLHAHRVEHEFIRAGLVAEALTV